MIPPSCRASSRHDPGTGGHLPSSSSIEFRVVLIARFRSEVCTTSTSNPCSGRRRSADRASAHGLNRAIRASFRVRAAGLEALGGWMFARSMPSSRVTSARPSGSSARRDVGGRADRGGWIPLVAPLLGKHADPMKHARIGVQSLHAGFARLRSESCQSVHVPGEDSHQTELQQGCVIRPGDHNGPVPIHWSPPCSQPHA